MNPTLKHWLGKILILGGPVLASIAVVNPMSDVNKPFMFLAGMTASVLGIRMVKWSPQSKQAATSLIGALGCFLISYPTFLLGLKVPLPFLSTFFILLGFFCLYRGLDEMRKSNS